MKNSIEDLPISFETLQSASHLWKYASFYSTDFFVIEFFADWCYPCKKIKNTLSSVSSSSKINLLEVDIDKHHQIAKSELFSVKTIPTLFIFKKGVFLLKIENSLVSKTDLEKILTL